ncbi:hypothetical protein GJ496_001508 [Pomphorhynchus laevis]|nr:hypothetical protein GJ496_001508 [Pomphorhynchus laevis]
MLGTKKRLSLLAQRETKKEKCRNFVFTYHPAFSNLGNDIEKTLQALHSKVPLDPIETKVRFRNNIDILGIMRSNKNATTFRYSAPWQKLNELLAELLWNNEDHTVEGKYGRIRRLKASLTVEE